MTIFDLDIYIRIDTVKSKTIISAHDLDEVFILSKYLILAVIGRFLVITGDRIDKSIKWSDESASWLTIGLFFSLVFGKEVWQMSKVAID